MAGLSSHLDASTCRRAGPPPGPRWPFSPLSPRRAPARTTVRIGSPSSGTRRCGGRARGPAPCGPGRRRLASTTRWGEGLKLTVDRGLRAPPWLCRRLCSPDAVTGGGGATGRAATRTARKTPEGASPLYQQTPDPVVRPPRRQRLTANEGFRAAGGHTSSNGSLPAVVPGCVWSQGGCVRLGRGGFGGGRCGGCRGDRVRGHSAGAGPP